MSHERLLSLRGGHRGRERFGDLAVAPIGASWQEARDRIRAARVPGRRRSALLDCDGQDHELVGAVQARGPQASPPWSEHAPLKPPEWLHSPSVHWTMDPLPFGKFSMHVCVEQNCASVA